MMPNASTSLRNGAFWNSVPAKRADTSAYKTASASSQCVPEIRNRGRSARGGARSTHGDDAARQQEPVRRQWPGHPELRPVACEGREKDRAAQRVRGIDPPYEHDHRDRRHEADRRRVPRRSEIGRGRGQERERGEAEAHHDDGRRDRRRQRSSRAHQTGRRRTSREARSSARAAPAARPPTSPTNTRSCSIVRRSFVGVVAVEKTSTPTLELPP